MGDGMNVQMPDCEDERLPGVSPNLPGLDPFCPLPLFVEEKESVLDFFASGTSLLCLHLRSSFLWGT